MATQKIADAEIRAELKSLGYSSGAFNSAGGCVRPDAYVESSTTLLLIEYENSSRGLSFHVLKWCRFAVDYPKKVKVLLIRSTHHSTAHQSDGLNAEYAIGNLKLPALFKLIVEPATKQELLAILKFELNRIDGLK